MFEQYGKNLALVGLMIAAGGGLFYLLGRLGVGHLPGDVSFGGRNWRVFLPLGTCLLISLLLTLLLILIHRFGKR